MKLPMVRVDWGDAWGAVALHPAHKHQPLMQSTAGWLIAKNEHGVMVVGQISVQGECKDVVFIPAGMIKKITRIKGQTVEYNQAWLG